MNERNILKTLICKAVRRKHREKACWHRCWQQFFFLDITSKPWAIKAKTNEWNYIKLKICCTAKDLINTTKIQPREWENILADHISDKGSKCNVYKELTQLKGIKK